MQTTLNKQYNAFASVFSNVHDEGENSNRDNREVFYSHIDFLKPGMNVLDLACGDGLDLVRYKTYGVEIHGVDASDELIKIAQARLPEDDIRVATFDALPYEDASFDVVLSKYAIQTAEDMRPCFEEIKRVLKPGGTVLYLVTHPLRQFMERKDMTQDYFAQTVVDSHILNGAVTVKEPTHSLNEYLTPRFLKHFDILAFDERWDAAAEQIGGGKYPGYFILKAVKRIQQKSVKIGVFSSANPLVSPENARLAEEVGKYLAAKNITVVTGGSLGIPGLVVKSAYEHGANTVAYSPDSDEASHHLREDNLHLQYFTEKNFVPGFTARSLKMIESVDAALVLNGRMGTLSEVTIALEEQLPLAVVEGTGGISDHLKGIISVANKECRAPVVFRDNYREAIDSLVEFLAKR